MRINVIRHTPNEGLGSIQDWVTKHGHDVYTYHPYQFNGVLPTADETDMLILLGGPMSINDEEDWMADERKLIQQLISNRVPVLGICFGCQAIANALGAAVVRSPAKEVGWAPIYLESKVIPGLPAKMTGLQWHQDMFELPHGAALLFSSDLVKNQGFVYNHQTVGIQFHFESDEAHLRELVINDGNYAYDSDLHQEPEDIMATPIPAENPQIMATILDYITADWPK